MIDVVFERKCIICKKKIKAKVFPAWVCKSCLKKIEFIKNIFCNRCGSPFEDKCICSNLNPAIVEIKSCFLYNNTGKELIHKWKYSRIFFVKDYFERIFFKNYPFKHINFEIILPIPIHFFKKILRGFNQTEILAEVISKNFKIPVDKSIKRKKYRKSQFLCRDYNERHKNISNVFIRKKEKSFKNILIIDDIVTSGATINEISKFFPESNIYVYTLAIAR